jgi:hypothetical protein
MERIIQFSRSVLYRKYKFEISPEDEAEHMQIKAVLDSCNFGFQNFMWQNHSSIDAKEREALKLARIHFGVCWIWIRTTLAIEESAYDPYVAEFTEIVDLCETLVSCSPPFSFNVGYIAPLYFVACKCRDRILRRRAVDLLYQAAPRREMLYTAEQAYKVAVRIIQLEEAGMDPTSTMRLPEDCSRIHFAEISQVDPSRPGPGKPKNVVFFSKPDGVTGEWKVQREFMVSTDIEAEYCSL